VVDLDGLSFGVAGGAERSPVVLASDGIQILPASGVSPATPRADGVTAPGRMHPATDGCFARSLGRSLMAPLMHTC